MKGFGNERRIDKYHVGMLTVFIVQYKKDTHLFKLDLNS